MILWTFPSVQPPLFFFASSRHHLLWYLRAGRLFAFAHPSHICLHKIRRHVDLLVQLSLTPRPPSFCQQPARTHLVPEVSSIGHFRKTRPRASAFRPRLFLHNTCPILLGSVLRWEGRCV